MRVHPRGKLGWAGLFGTVLLLTIGSGAAWWYTVPTAKSTSPISATNNRQRYATLYEAGWRQDDGRDATLVTATLLVPPTIAALGADTERSGTEEQLWNFVKNIDAATVPIVLTIDSVTGFISDETIQNSLELQAADGTTFSLRSWQSMIAPSKVVNTPGPVSSQSGLVVFSAERDIDWPTLGTLKLNVNGLGGEPQRVMTWVEPQLLLGL